MEIIITTLSGNVSKQLSQLSAFMLDLNAEVILTSLLTTKIILFFSLLRYLPRVVLL